MSSRNTDSGSEMVENVGKKKEKKRIDMDQGQFRVRAICCSSAVYERCHLHPM